MIFFGKLSKLSETLFGTSRKDLTLLLLFPEVLHTLSWSSCSTLPWGSRNSLLKFSLLSLKFSDVVLEVLRILQWNAFLKFMKFVWSTRKFPEILIMILKFSEIPWNFRNFSVGLEPSMCNLQILQTSESFRNINEVLLNFLEFPGNFQNFVKVLQSYLNF